MATVAEVWKLRQAYDGMPKLSDFQLEKEELPPLMDGQILTEAMFLTVDPYMRVFVEPDKTMPGEQVAKVIDSRADGFPAGSMVVAHVGWRSHTVIDVSQPQDFNQKVEIVPEIAGLSPSLWLGAIGMPGVTAYMAFLENCDPKPDEVVVVSAASGAVGSIVGQLAKNTGCHAIGFAGTKEKCAWLKELGFHHAFNYKEVKVEEALDKAAPDGVDIYYDNVGGSLSHVVFKRLKHRGRVLVCGQMAHYNESEENVPNPYLDILLKELNVKGFTAFTHIEDFARVRPLLTKLVQDRKLQTRETITIGFNNMPQAFIDLFTGASIGKKIVKM